MSAVPNRRICSTVDSSIFTPKLSRTAFLAAISLTTKGKEVAEKIYERHRFFTKRLIAAGVDPKTAERDACRLEHAISEESFQKLKDALED